MKIPFLKIYFFKKTLIAGAVFVGFFLFLNPLFSKAQTANQVSSGCGRWNISNTSGADFYQGFGVPWNVLSEKSNNLVDVFCTQTGANLLIGENSTEDLYIWKYAYISAGGGPWTRIALRGGGNAAGWYRRTANTRIPGSMIQKGASNYILFYTCQQKNGKWYCGCRKKTSCDESGLWQLQEVIPSAKPPEFSGDLLQLGAFDIERPTIFYPSRHIFLRNDSGTVSGGGFEQGDALIFKGYGSVPIEVNQNGTKVSFQIPDDMEYGRYDVWMRGDQKDSNHTFIIVQNPQAPTPEISSVSPKVVRLGERMTVYGSGFSKTRNTVFTSIGSVSGISSETGTTLTFFLPTPVTTSNIPSVVESFLGEYNVTKREFVDFQKRGLKKNNFQRNLFLQIISQNGISGQVNFKLEM